MNAELTRPTARRVSDIRERIYEDETGLERLIFFSDAVFAIAITLLALEIRLPTFEGEVSNEALLAALEGLWPRYLAYGISFLAVGLYWMLHHRIFRTVVRYDARMMLLNLSVLAGIGLMPFATSVISEHANSVGTQLYGLVAAVVGLLLAVLWWYAHGNNRLSAAASPAGEARRDVIRVLAAPVVFGLSALLACWNPDLAQLSWALIALVALIH